MINALLFDWYNTLVEPVPEIENSIDEKIIRALTDWGVDVSRNEFQHTRSFYWNYYQRKGKACTPGDIGRKMFHEMGIVIEDEEKARLIRSLFVEYHDAVKPVPEVRKILQQLRANGYYLALVANACLFAEANVFKTGLRLFFDTIVFSAEVGTRKPQSEIYRLAAQNLGVRPENCVFIGDELEEDVWGPKRVQMKTVWIQKNSVNDAELFFPCEPDRMIQNLDSLEASLKKL